MMPDAILNEKALNILDPLLSQLEIDPEKNIQWHPKFNVYVLKNNDVFLVSSTQQWLLTALQFPFFALIKNEGNKGRIYQCIKRHYGSIELDVALVRQAMMQFDEQVTQLINQALIIEDDVAPPFYCKPEYYKLEYRQDKSDKPLVKGVTDNIQLLSLSVLPKQMIDEWMLQFYHELALQLEGWQDLHISLVLVDDMLDPRVSQLTLHASFFVLQIDPDRLWLSPCFELKNIEFFLRFQRRLLSNQPIKQWLELKWPDVCHAYPVRADMPVLDPSDKQNGFIVQMAKKVSQLLARQLTLSEDVLWAYNADNNAFSSHPINHELKSRELFYPNMQSPIHLSQDVSCPDIEGGLRVVDARCSVNRLLTLVSPITGVINHLTQLNQERDHPIHVYRTGFFRPLNLANSETNERFVQICLGKGVCTEQSKASGLSEAIERYCAIYQKELPILHSSPQALKAAKLRYFDFHCLNPFSETQYDAFERKQHTELEKAHSVKRYKGQAIHWLPSWSLTHNEWVYFPMSLGASQLPFDDMQYGRWHSNGCAAGNTVEEAILQGLLELIERDAVAIWWYNRLVCPEFDLSRIDEARLNKLKMTLSSSIENWADRDNKDIANQAPREAGYDFWVLDLTHDLGVPVMAAIGKHAVTGQFILGFGCHLQSEVAAERALTELCQLQLIANRHSAPFDFNAIIDSEYLYPQRQSQVNQHEFNVPYSMSYQSDQTLDRIIKGLVCKLKTLGFEISIYNYSHGEIMLKTVKVMVPGLCHIWPQLGNQRLYQLPVALKLRQQALDETSINQHWLYI
ncbi:YcaO-like family protein [uncultured Shewanella sp.]|uniref:YcaO-like family protein n=1 Tax=uncultured Shewanella sp. TaxID=173975 RepID=UPI0026131F2F|nr:YcaO-like family protein [uncultured Shewanella sp.]